MQLALPLLPNAPPRHARPDVRSLAPDATPTPGASPAPAIEFVRRRGARRYILRVLDDGTLRVTVPWWGSRREARQFAESQQAWVARQRTQRAARVASRWGLGVTVLVDGSPHALTDLGGGRVAIGGHVVDDCREPGSDPGPAVRAWLRQRAVAHLPGELQALAEQHGIAVTRDGSRVSPSPSRPICQTSSFLSLSN